MAKFKSSTFGKISGKHGDVVAVTMKDGTTYFRAHIIPPNPNTIKQQSQRSKFGFAVRELNCMRKLFTVTFGGQYGINRAVSLAMKTCVSGEFPDFRIDYSRLQLAVGNLVLPSTQSLQKLADKVFKLMWSYNEELLENPADELSIVVFNNTLKQIIHLQNNALRASRAVEFSLPDSWLSSEIHVWLYFSSANNNTFSNSKYFFIKLK
jgi:hypothetical protein